MRSAVGPDTPKYAMPVPPCADESGVVRPDREVMSLLAPLAADPLCGFAAPMCVSIR